MEFAGKKYDAILLAAAEAVKNGATPVYVMKYLTDRGANPEQAERAVLEAMEKRKVADAERVELQKAAQVERREHFYPALAWIILGILGGAVATALGMNMLASAGVVALVVGVKKLIYSMGSD